MFFVFRQGLASCLDEATGAEVRPVFFHFLGSRSGFGQRSLDSSNSRLDGTLFEHPSWLVLVEGLRCLTYLQDGHVSSVGLSLRVICRLSGAGPG